MKYDLLTKKKIIFISLASNTTFLIGNDVKQFTIDFFSISSFFINMKKKNIIVYATDLNLIALLLLNKNCFALESWNKKSFLFNNTFYYLSFSNSNTKITFKNFKCFFPINIADLEKKLPNTLCLSKESNKYQTFINSVFLLKLLDKEFTLYMEHWNRNIYAISSFAMYIYINHFNSLKVSFSQTKMEYLFFKRAFYGGRNEIFGNPIKGEKIYHYDFPLMYANIMKNSKFAYGPYKTIRYEYLFTKEEKNNIKDYEKKKNMVSMFNDVNFYTPGFYYIRFQSNLDIPILPFKTYEEGLIFPNGSFLDGLYWWEEIIDFLSKKGEIIWVYKAYIFTNYDYIFKNLSSNLIPLRFKSEFNNVLYKSILVSFYGRLGMNFKKKETLLFSKDEYYSFYEKHDNARNILQELWLNSYVIVEINTETTNDEDMKHLPDSIDLTKVNLSNFDILDKSDVKIAAQITAKARTKLNNFIYYLKNNGFKIYYCDTDSVFFGAKVPLTTIKINNETIDINSMLLKDAFFFSNKFYYTKDQNDTINFKISGINTETTDFKINKLKELFFSEEHLKIKNKKVLNKFQFETHKFEINLYFNKYKKRTFYFNKRLTKPLYIVHQSSKQ